MPPIRTLTTTSRPVKTERTHEENQERAYIAASRRSDRSLEARIESARRASEIHKKRTGRSLRVTEQDVVNEEMYEEEDDDLPTQYQRLSAHLQSNSIMFNRKLHDYIATQTAVRNSFMQQQFPFGQPYPVTPVSFPQGLNPFMGHQMPSPPAFNPSSQQMNFQPSQPFSPSAFAPMPNNYRHAPYPMTERPQAHQRSASVTTPQQPPDSQQPGQQTEEATESNLTLAQRRMSMPLKIEAKVQRPSLSRSTTAQSRNSPLLNVSPHTSSPQNAGSVAGTPILQGSHFTFAPSEQATRPQTLGPLSLSLPPESQQFIGSALDPHDPTTAILMAGSDNLPQPFQGTYSYNANVTPKLSRPWNPSTRIAGTAGLESGSVAPSTKLDALDTSVNTPSQADTNSAVSESLISPTCGYNNDSYDMSILDDMYGNVDLTSSGQFGLQDDFDASAFFNFSDWPQPNG